MSRRLTRPACGLMLGLALTLTTQSSDARELPDSGVVHSAPGLLEPDSLGGMPILASDESSDYSGEEVIRERYANRSIKIERHVVQDADGNYVNHGPWTMWDETGRMMGTGQYSDGQRDGKWTRWFAPGEGELFEGEVFQQFQAPFVSQVTLEGGQLHGTWAIMDAQKREVSAWQFRNGKRHGKSVWWYPNGQKWREVDYRDGIVDGLVMEWGADHTLVRKDVYISGRRLGTKVEWHSPGIKQYEAEYLFAEDVLEASDDWWAGSTKVKLLGKEGEDQRHGLWVSWDKNGQKLLEGRYKFDKPVGTFTWWHSNGQKAIEGVYESGEQHGEWTWWHTNGQKQISGGYEHGEQSGAWNWWDTDGKAVASAIYADAGADLAETDVEEYEVIVDEPVMNFGSPKLFTETEEPAPIQTEEPSYRGGTPVRMATPPARLLRR